MKENYNRGKERAFVKVSASGISPVGIQVVVRVPAYT